MKPGSFDAAGEFSTIKRLIWLYFWLLIFEGALRKWVLPQVATPLLIVRDPVAVAILVIAISRGIFPKNLSVIGAIAIGIISIPLAILFGHGSSFVAFFGARILLLHFPVLFVIAKVFDREDVIRLGRAMLWTAIPMTVLIAFQFYSPQSAWINRGLGGDLEGAGFSGALGFFRPSGTFSFTSGNVQFFSFLAPFIVYFGIERRAVSRLLWLTATAALLLAVPFSISRSLFFQLGLTLLFALAMLAHTPRLLVRMLGIVLLASVIIGVASQRPVVQTAIEAFSVRFESANEAEGGVRGTLGDRFLGGMVSALAQSFKHPFFGAGIGMGTNAGAKLLTGKQTFLISEGEWGRLIGEMGPLLGIILIGLRLGVCVQMVRKAFRVLNRGSALPWLLLSFALINVGQGQWAQPTSLGFAIISAGAALAACRPRVSKAEVLALLTEIERSAAKPPAVEAAHPAA